ncbi:MAG: ketoacyl-ACP synthase III [Crocinitomicaceae bacterium]|nr:ketoacyl-ACP synthase III [Crocinitomicaceae bacterium]
MALTKYKGIDITGIVNVVPETTEDNLDLELLTPEERAALVNHTGIRFRKVAPESLTIRDLFEKAIVKLLDKTGWKKEEVDVLICVTQSPEMIIPSVSCRLHGDLKFPGSTMCFDINSGCSGFVYGLHTVGALLAGMETKNAKAILCCGDLSTHLINATDKSVRPIFSDGVAAIAVERNADNSEITGYFNLETAGKGQHAIEMQKENGGQAMKLNGIDVFGYSVKLVPENIQKLMEFSQQEMTFPDVFVFHQANKLINESIRRTLGIPEEKVPYSITDYGNTASASIPMTLGTGWKDAEQHSGWIVVSGFGVGFSVASALIRFSPLFCEPPEEY